ncbi:ribosomal protein S18-alanine N-acetyltransferase [Pseudobacillus badius]|uniref:ribosomal protein S18-alanine N-acetyltransferase n=1 Tax=Bacillus badius TaxID=1455 RepID=UPI0007B0AE68|nr:ribosomal protein S18-alanine N-acetyltransferase [Bacillus badius]KZO00889.1 ribosomal-protein-alanine N-acetyltransferase RimI [Bacillus badius]MED0665768.1 ribosomal protein S18-alanine N-acetyltransferase [Bacillus badius]OCS88819.1 ribosomal-protein-alanine N-acetyltransferase [Bacillus badius]OVE49625.1 ribosomal-protein-alanine N-acetyltransferase [Bacillus badius]TDW01006.1 [SSU ribosomal protein S18P]-alanine acetyltransferase [Bacillus badius]
MSEVDIRLMTVEDVDKVHEIEKNSFTMPWTKESFWNELTNNYFAVYHVAEYEGEIVGYCGMWLVLDESQITNIAILPEYRGRGLGEKLLVAVMNAAKKKGAAVMSLEVRVSNEPAQGLYKKLGFQPGGIRKNYYSDNQEDALVMWVRLS